MNTIGAQPLRKRNAIIDDERDLSVGANTLKRLGETRYFVLRLALHAQLKGCNGLDVGNGFQPLGEVPAHVLRGDQVEPAGFRPPRRRKFGRIEIVVQSQAATFSVEAS